MRAQRLPPALAGAATLALLGACMGAGANAPAGQPPSSAIAAPGEQVSTVTVYAAASVQTAFTDLINAFEQANPTITVEPVYDGSATLVTQLTDGAEADVLAAADTATMAEVVTAGLAARDPEVFATNTLVIAVPAGNPRDVADLADLGALDYVVCAPEVPCGAATTSLLELNGVAVDAVSQEQNVTAVAERVARGEVDAGLVYATDVAARDLLEAVVPSAADRVVNRYPIATLNGAGEAAAAFVALVLSDEGRAVLAEHGFGAP